MRRVTLMLTAMALALLLASGVALAVTKIGTNGPDTLRGTNGNDRLEGRGGDDKLKGGKGDDKIFPGTGDDKVRAGPGDDRIYARDQNGVDFIDCGGGFDKVETIHRDDETLGNCERALGPRQGDI